MTAFFNKHATLVLASFLAALLILSWVIPSERLFFGITFVLFSFLVAGAAVLEKHREAYRQGRVRRGVLCRNILLEITGVGIAMLLAGLLGKYAAGLAAQQVEGGPLRLVAGLVVGLLAGLGVGVLARRTWRRLVRAASET
jgi:hypothetical protein